METRKLLVLGVLDNYMVLACDSLENAVLNDTRDNLILSNLASINKFSLITEHHLLLRAHNHFHYRHYQNYHQRQSHF